MKLIRFGDHGKEKSGLLLEDGSRVDVSDAAPDYNEEFFSAGGVERLRQWVEMHRGRYARVEPSVRLGPSICRPSKIVCIGLNYRDHAAETGQEVPKEPVIFFKATSSLVGSE